VLRTSTETPLTVAGDPPVSQWWARAGLPVKARTAVVSAPAALRFTDPAERATSAVSMLCAGYLSEQEELSASNFGSACSCWC
jgi:hypothetical protein